jgi:hypothetical protein
MANVSAIAIFSTAAGIVRAEIIGIIRERP